MMKHGLNLYRVTRATGLRVKRISDDWLEWDLQLRLTLRNRNFVGTHFGGSLYAGADPQFMLSFLHLMPDLIVWDKAATIRFRKPGKGTLTGEVRIPPDEPDAIRVALAAAPRGRIDRTYGFAWRDGDGDVVAEIDKVLHFRTKEAT